MRLHPPQVMVPPFTSAKSESKPWSHTRQPRILEEINNWRAAACAAHPTPVFLKIPSIISILGRSGIWYFCIWIDAELRAEYEDKAPPSPSDGPPLLPRQKVMTIYERPIGEHLIAYISIRHYSKEYL
ncbi:hypothetical protein Y032_0029g1905 [Ancylostoma ceylanicum]|uniref:Uncharacterized protein n=1 Tax=Ancylostoma ceylanicum TaxID=53326 RepID=A0A016URK0_9BILA|nr:hypothetical protein Y032_0029g1905 [Ancylostoma ceylanicum]